MLEEASEWKQEGEVQPQIWVKKASALGNPVISSYVVIRFSKQN
jgi:hypothetical protein